MQMNRVTFLALAASLGAVACGSSTVDVESDEGAIQARQCTNPGDEGPTPDSRLGFCTDFATKAAAMGEDFRSIESVCRGYLMNFKSAAADRAQSCMSKLRKVDIEQMGPSFDWTGLYECGYLALTGTCELSDAAEVCQGAITDRHQQMTWTDMSEPELVQEECRSFISGLKKSGAEQVITCVTREKFPVYSCVEGLEGDVTAKSVCVDTKRRGEETRLHIAERCTQSLDAAAQAVCLKFVKATRVAIAERFVTEVQQAGVDQPAAPSASVVHNIGVRVLREGCRLPSEVDATCAEVVKKYTAAGRSNEGGRITRECRAIFPGLLKSARDRVLAGRVPADGRISSAIVALPTASGATAEEFPETAE